MDEITKSSFSLQNKIYRVVWAVFNLLFFRYSPRPFFKWRVLILKLFGAKIAFSCRVYGSSKIWSPKNLIMEEQATIGPNANIYNQGTIKLCKLSTVSQNASLCASSHRYQSRKHELILCPITINEKAWICAEAFVGPNVNVGEGAVLGARSVAKKDLEPWAVYDGNPCVKVKDRIMKDN